MKKIIFLSVLLVGCQNIPYRDDTGFLVSAQANSPELVVYVNGALCKDMDGQAGLCSKRIRTIDTLTIAVDPQPYAYDLTVACTSPLVLPGISVGANQPGLIAITPSMFLSMRTFQCVGELFPQDRTQPLSAKFDVRVVVYDANYVRREAITSYQEGGVWHLVLGQYARSAWVFDGTSWASHWNETDVTLPAGIDKVQAYSESYQARINTFHLSGPVVQ